MKPKVLGKGTELSLTGDQRDRLRAFATQGQGGYQSLCDRVADSAKPKGSGLVAIVYPADMQRIRQAVEREDDGGWQGLLREIVAAND